MRRFLAVSIDSIVTTMISFSLSIVAVAVIVDEGASIGITQYLPILLTCSFVVGTMKHLMGDKHD